MPEKQPGFPATALADPQMQKACRERDFGLIFRLAKARAGIYPSRIASLCGMTPSRVGEIMSGQRRLAHIDVIERVADGLRIPGAMLGLAHRPWELPHSTAAPVREADPAPPVSTPAARRAPDRADLDDLLTAVEGPVTRSSLVAMQSSIEDYWRRDDQHGGASLRPAVVGHLRYVTSRLAHVPAGPLADDLRALAAELARMAGWAYFDARQYSTARTYFRQALDLARETGDASFTANVLSCLSLQATYENRETEAVALASAAQDVARRGTTSRLVVSMLAMREAFAHAALRDAAACHDALRRANDAFAAAEPPTEAPAWVRYFDETKLIVDTGIALGQLGEASRAESLITEGLRRERVDQQRGRAFHTVWLADVQLQQGKLDAAVVSATAALDLTATLDSPRVAGHLREFHTRLAPFAREPAVLGFEERMRSALA